MGTAVIQEQDIQAVREGLGKSLDEELEQVRAQIGQFQTEALTRGGRHGPVDIKPCEDVLNGPHGLDATGRSSTSAHRQQAEPAFVLAKHPDRAAGVGRDDALQALTTRSLEPRDGLRIFLCDWGAAL
jgi:hypothetical protein